MSRIKKLERFRAMVESGVDVETAEEKEMNAFEDPSIDWNKCIQMVEQYQVLIRLFSFLMSVSIHFLFYVPASDATYA